MNEWETPDEPIERGLTFETMVSTATVLLRDVGLHPARNLALQAYRALRGPARFNLSLPEPENEVEPAEANRYLEIIEALSDGAPLAAAVGWTGFRHLSLEVSGDTLIPRPETEELVELALARVSTGVAADLGTGTGAIALSLVKEGSFSRVIGTDISPGALRIARRNGKQLGLKVDWRRGDLLESLAKTRVDLLMSNPPYLTPMEYDALPRSVKNWEPATALIGGHDGMEFYRRLLGLAQQHLNPGAWIALEVDSRRARETGELAKSHGWADVRIQDDLFGRARFLLARRGETP